MNSKDHFVLLSTAVALLLAACGAAQPTATMVPPTEPPAIPTDTPSAAENTNTGITVTFEGEQCVYHGPERVPAGQIPVSLDVRVQSAREAYSVIAYTLDEGKTIEDLRAWKSVGHSPTWVGFHGMLWEQPPGTMQETTIILFEGPLFLACITEPPGYITDVLGPIEIVPAAAAAQVEPADTNQAITVIFEDDQCVYQGPERVPAGQIRLTLDVRGQSAHEGYSVGAFTLDEGKTGEDLQASDGVHTPLWAHFHGIVEAAPGSSQETSIILFEGPLYLACQTSSPLVNTNVLGPIEIEPPVQK